MILISHRGNINGRSFKDENQPTYIDTAISAGYDVEIDILIKSTYKSVPNTITSHMIKILEY